jgi:hypothetical protein
MESKQMKKQITEEVDIAQLLPHPKCESIYRKIDNDDLANEILANGILHLPIVDTQYRIIGGERTVEAAKLAGYKTIKVTIVDISEEDAPAYRVFSNNIRNKSDTEIFIELQILREFYGTRQGKRPVMHESQIAVENEPLRTKMEKVTGVNGTKIQRIENLAQHNLLAYSDKNSVPKTALYNAMERKATDINKYQASVSVPLVSKCCEQCKQPVGRIIVTRANTLQYKSDTPDDQIRY